MVSVIVPIFNIEEQLPRCIESLKCIEGDSVEVLLIDDGSTDHCPRIVDNVRDKRFRVFHTDNKGLSATRNFGIEQSYGEWLMFVDGDDFVEPGFCSTPLLFAEQYGADLVAFRARTWRSGREQKPKRWKAMKIKEHPCGIITAEQAIEFGGVYAWNKLYRRELFGSIRYPNGRVYEDYAVTHRLIYRAKKIILIPDILYNHVIRENSISNTASESNRKDAFLSALERFTFLNEHNYPVEKHQAVLWKFAMGYLARATTDDIAVKQAADVLNSIKGFPSDLSIERRIMLFIWRIDKRLFHFICRLFGKKKTSSQPIQ